MKLLLAFVASSLLASVSAVTCNADNCLRAFKNRTNTAVATSFCNLYTQPSPSATPSVPARFASACGSGSGQAARLSSACACFTVTTTSTQSRQTTVSSRSSQSSQTTQSAQTTSSSPTTQTTETTSSSQITQSSDITQSTQTTQTSSSAQPTTTCGDLTSDNNNCGTCGNVCASGSTCQSGICTVAPRPCANYTASCSSLINGILASNSIASPDLVNLRIQSAIEGITSPGDFLAALGPNPCQIYTDQDEYNSCLSLVGNSDFITRLYNFTTEFLGEIQTCAADFAAGRPDSELVITDPNNTNCTRNNHPGRRDYGFETNYDLTERMLQGIELSRDLEVVSAPGPAKSTGLSLFQRQANTCSRTGSCFEACPDCRNQQTYCGSSATAIARTVCASLAAIANAAVAAGISASCGAACGPGAVVCAAFCGRAAGGLTAVVVGGNCEALRSRICEPLTAKCANCNSANNGICDANSSQCCAGETGTSCGQGCCCCPRCYAPGGINCACTPAAC